MKSIFAVCGSRRNGSFNQALLDQAIGLIEANDNVSVDLVAAADLGFPLFEEDLESADGIPAGAKKLHERMAACDGFVVATPEYNGGYTPLLKNTIDWVSRVDPTVFGGRYVGILTASPGGGGGARAAKQTADLFAGVRSKVHAPTFSLPSAHEALTPAPVSGLSEWVTGYLDGLVDDNSE